MSSRIQLRFRTSTFVLFFHKLTADCSWLGHNPLHSALHQQHASKIEKCVLKLKNPLPKLILLKRRIRRSVFTKKRREHTMTQVQDNHLQYPRRTNIYLDNYRMDWILLSFLFHSFVCFVVLRQLVIQCLSQTH